MVVALMAISVAILGPGAVGGFLAAGLARAGTPVTVVAREPTAALIAREGIRVRSALIGELTVRVDAVIQLERPVDVLLVATKANGLDAALERVAVPPELVVPLLNGLEHVERLRDRFGADRVAAGTIRIQADRPRPAWVVQTSSFATVELASGDPAPRARLGGLAATLRAAGVAARVQDSEAQILWAKLVRLNALACTTSALDRPLGAIRADRVARELLENCVREATAVARAEGAQLDPSAVIDELDALPDGASSSMRRDVAAGRPPELDAIAGAILRAGSRHRLACPTIAELAERIARRAGVRAPV